MPYEDLTLRPVQHTPPWPWLSRQAALAGAGDMSPITFHFHFIGKERGYVRGTALLGTATLFTYIYTHVPHWASARRCRC